MAFFTRIVLLSPKVRVFGLAAAALVLAGCSGGDKDSGNIAPTSDVPSTYSALYTQVLGVTTASGCAHEDCHTGENANIGGPDFRNKTALYTALTTKIMDDLEWNEVGINCGNFKPIEPSDATKSLLVGTVVDKGDPSDVFDKTSCVPRRNTHFNANGPNAKVTLDGNKAKGLVEWIKAGAPNN